MNKQKLIEYIGKELEMMTKYATKCRNENDEKSYHFALGNCSALERLLIDIVRGDFK